jgi:DNA-binding NtrC family response regulator
MHPDFTEMSPYARKNFPMLNVLVVDDEALIRWSLGESLAEAGYAVREAGDAASAIAAASDGLPLDAIVLDYRLPDSNDLRLLETLRRLQPHAAVVMMTAFGTPEMASGALELGAYRVVPKPFDVHAMVELVTQAHEAARRA